MLKKIKIETLSQWMIVLATVSVLFNYFLGNTVSTLFALNSVYLLEYHQYWRIFTYTILPGSLESLILFSFSLFFLSPYLIKKLGNKNLNLLYLAITVLNGIVLLILNQKSHVFFYGADGISFFLISSFILNFLIKGNQEKSRSTKKIKDLTLIMVCIWLATTILRVTTITKGDIFSSLFTAELGIASGLYLYLHQKIMIKKELKKERVPQKYFVPEISESLQEPYRTSYNTFPHRQNVNDEAYLSPDYNFEEIYSEDNLNLILDKINESGKESLTNDELHFLRNYSNLIK